MVKQFLAILAVGAMICLACASPTGQVAENDGIRFSMSIGQIDQSNQTCPSTPIQFSDPTAEYVTLEIYSATGYLIRTILDNEFFEAGSFAVEWELDNDNGELVRSGFYIYEFKAGPYEAQLIQYLEL